MEAGILDGDTRRQGKGLGKGLIFFAELLGADLVSEIEIAVDRGADTDGNAEKRLHVRMAGWEAVAVGMVTKIRQAQWYRLGDHHAQHPPAGRAGTDRLFFGVAQPDSHELLEGGPRLIEHA